MVFGVGDEQLTRKLWRDRVKPALEPIEWPLVALLAGGAIVLGFAGFSQHLEATGQPHSFWDSLYRTLQLFVLESGWDGRDVNWELEIARILAPAVAFYAGVRALLGIFRDEFQLLRVRFWRDHVVVCGLGRMGVLMAEGFRERDKRVTAIEWDEENPAVEHCRDQGIPVRIADATDPAMLRKARAHRADHLIAVCGNDGKNADVAAHAKELARAKPRRDRVLTAYAHVIDLELCQLLRRRVAEAERLKSFRLELFNIFESGAREWLAEHPPFGDDQAERAHLLVVGVGEMGMSLVAEAVRKWVTLHADGDRRLRITIVDCEARRRINSLRLRHPRLDSVCELVPVETDVTWPEFEQGAFLYDREGRLDVTRIFVCLDDDVRGVAAALALLGRVREHGVPIVVRTAEEAGLAAVVGREPARDDSFELLETFPLLDRTCRPDLLLGETFKEALARAIHEAYVQHERAAGNDIDDNPALVNWPDLSDDLKESNRRQADHIEVKLKAIACRHGRLTEGDADRFEFSPEEIEQLARMEHERWLGERLFEGWTHAPPPKDLVRKTSPDLVAWDTLPEEEKRKDRDAIRAVPALLATAGYRVFRTDGRERDEQRR